jgi:hypothetical protein
MKEQTKKPKYFRFINDHKITRHWIEEFVIIPAGQPVEIKRMVEEWGHCYLIDGVTAEIPLCLGTITEDITQEEELSMWKLLCKLKEFNLQCWLRGDLRDAQNQSKELQKLYQQLHEQEGVINALKEVIKYERTNQRDQDYRTA